MDQGLLNNNQHPHSPCNNNKEQEIPRAQLYVQHAANGSSYATPSEISMDTAQGGIAPFNIQQQQHQQQHVMANAGGFPNNNANPVNGHQAQPTTFGDVNDVSVAGPLLLTKEGDVALVIAHQGCVPNVDLLSGSRLLPVADISSVAVGKSTGQGYSVVIGFIWLIFAVGVPLGSYAMFSSQNDVGLGTSYAWLWSLAVPVLYLVFGARHTVALIKAIVCCTPFSIRIDFKNGFTQSLELDARACREDVDTMSYINSIAEARKHFRYDHGSANVNVIREFTLPTAECCSCDDAPSLTVTDEYILHKFTVRGSANCHMIVLDDVGEIYLGPCNSTRAKFVGVLTLLVAIGLGVGVGVTAGQQNCVEAGNYYDGWFQLCNPSNTAPIIGGVCGAILLFLGAILIVLCCLRTYCIVVYPKMHPGAVSYGAWSGYHSTGYPISFICANNKEYPREIYNCIRNAQLESSRNRRRMSLAPANGPNTR